jgi:sugar lactone lactonase YvrE
MKRSLYIFAIIFLCVVSCKRATPTVIAYFEVGADECQILDDVPVVNMSSAIDTQVGLCKWEWEDQVSYKDDLEFVSFSTVGEHEIKLTVWGEQGLAQPNTYTRTILAYDNNEPPVVAFDLPESAVQDSPLQFTDKSTDATGRIVSWEWNIGGVNSTDQNPVVSLISWGEIDVTLKVTDNYGKSNTLKKTMAVSRSDGHDLTVEWTRSYDDEGYVYWTSPAVSPDGSSIYVSSSGYHLVCFSPDGSEKGRFDIGRNGANPNKYDDKGQASFYNQTPTPSVAPDGKVYIPVQFYENFAKAPAGTVSNGGLFCVSPNCSGEEWYFPTGVKSSYRFIAPPVFGDYVAICLRENDSQYIGQNCGVVDRNTGKLIQALTCDQGSYGGLAVAADNSLVYGSARSGAGYKVARYSGKWTTSANSDAGRATNFLNGSNYETKGFQPAISKDNFVYVCASSAGTNMVCACYDLTSYTGGAPKPIWETLVAATTYQCGYGAVLDDAGNAYYMAGNKVFRLNRNDGKVAWEYTWSANAVGVAAIDSKGYLYVCDCGGNRLDKLSAASGQVVTEIQIDEPRSCPTIDNDGNIYVTGNKNGKPTLYKIVGTGQNKTVAPGANWSQLGGNPQKNGCTPSLN